MKTHGTTIFLSLALGLIGGISGQYLFTDSPAIEQTTKNVEGVVNPNQVQTDLNELIAEIDQLQKKIKFLEVQVTEISKSQSQSENKPDYTIVEETIASISRIDSPETSNRDNLVSAGINPDIVDDILQRISQQQYRRLQLNNLIERADDSDRQQYTQELSELSQNRILLRSELGDDAYDQYLFASGQDNRVKVLSVMSGSPAETYGFQSEDIILSYNEQKILSWRDLRKATLQGEIGSYTNVEILRDGSRMNFSVPRGTLGVQLAAVQLQPGQ